MTGIERTDPARPGRPDAPPEGRFRRAFEDSASGMALIEGRGEGAGHFLEVNRALARISGYPAERLLAMSYRELLHPDEAQEVAVALAELVSGRRTTLHTERRLVAADGETRWIALSASVLRDERGGTINVVAQAQDVTERKRAERELRYLADHDPLTGLFNRRRFELELELELSRAARYGPGGAILVLDLDGFKLVNDSRGHAAGDELLVEVAAALRRRLRDTDVVARLGGDEFGVIVPHADEERAKRVAEDLRAAVRELGIGVSVSVGIRSYDGSDEPPAGGSAVADADAAMYAAKREGRDRARLAGANG